MKNLFIGISDVHISLKNLDVSIQVLTHSLEKARGLKVPLCILGDLNDTKAIMRSEWVTALIKLFTEYIDIEIHILDGNHDLSNKASDQSSLDFLELLQNVKVYHQMSHVTFNGIEFGLIPYQNKNEDFLHCLEQMKVRDISNLLTHQGFLGAFMGDYAIDESSVDPEALKDFDIVLSGHYHKHQHVGDNIMYFGSPFTVNFGEAGHDKFFWQVYEAEGKIHTQPHLTNVRKHVQVEVGALGLEKERSNDETNLKPEDLLKVVLSGTKEFCLSTSLKQVQDAYEHKNVTIVPNIQRQSEIRIDQSIANKPIQVIEKYLEDAETDFDKEKLKEHLWAIVADIINKNSSNASDSIKVVKAEGRNFLSFKDIQWELLAQGLTLIEGHDEDHDISTGAGKSSFLDLVCYALFGKTSKKLKADEVINRQAGSNCFASVDVSTSKGNLFVTRYRKDETHENDLSFQIDAGPPIRGKDNLETQKLLEAELGMSFEMFLRSSYFTQFGTIDRFLSAPDAEKKEIISEICDTQIYDEITEALKVSIKDLKKKWIKSEKEYISVESHYETIKSSMEDNSKSTFDWEAQRKSSLHVYGTKSKEWEDNHANEIQELEKLHNDFESTKQDKLSKAGEEYNQWIVEYKNSLSNIQEEISSKQDILPGFKNKSIIPEFIDYTDFQEAIKTKLHIITSLQTEINKFDGAVHSKELKIAELKSQIEEAHSQTSTSKCLHCFQPISKDHIDKHVHEITLLIGNEDRERRIILAKKSEVLESMSIKADLEKRLRNTDALEYEQKVKTDQAKSMMVRVETLESEIKWLQDSLTKPQTNPHQAVLREIEKSESPYGLQIVNKNRDINPYIERIKSETERKNPYLELEQGWMTKLESASLSKASLSSEMNMLETEQGYSTWWKDAVHVYIKSYLTDSFIEQINQKSNDILTQKFDGVLSLHISATKTDKKTTKEKINVVIYNNGDECSYNSLSGGERCRICFALNIAIASVTGINLGFLMFDEILNGLDDVGKAQVMKVLKELGTSYGSIFMIDHTTEFKSLFTNTILIKKIGGISQVA